MSTAANEKNAYYLTEAILSIHNEVQSALDYISTVATQEGTELGKSTAILSIENLRVKVPLKFSIETEKTKPETTTPTRVPATTATTSAIRTDLTKRTGLVLERDVTKNLSIASKVKIAFKPEDIVTSTTTKTPTTTTTTDTQKEAWGEIEITFSPIKRQ
ncbi:MAG: hypothetical protein ACQCN3_04245 [Candidatus Bathyarchaeia archaeon]|jgi:hypothetical protein